MLVSWVPILTSLNSGPSAPGCFFVIEDSGSREAISPLHELGDRFGFPELDDSTSAAVDDQGKLTSSSPSLSVGITSGGPSMQDVTEGRKINHW